MDRALVVELSGEIVSAYVSRNSVHANELSDLIGSVIATLQTLGHPVPQAEELKPAVPIKKSIGSDHIVCLEDGLKFKSLKRHLRSRYGMSPQQYRERWGLDEDYPMVAPAYARERSQLAKKMGLGQQRRRKLA